MESKSEQNKFRNPALTVDIIILDEKNEKVVLIERKNPPHGFALPGGFVDYGESVENAAIREAKEETNLDCELLCQFHVYSDPSRDSRFHTASVVFVARGKGVLQGMDDAKNAQWFSLDSLPILAFDHARILLDFQNQFLLGKREFFL